MIPGAIVHDPDAVAREFARDRERHGVHAALARRVGGLADLPVERGDARGADDDAPVAAVGSGSVRAMTADAWAMTLYVPIRLTRMIRSNASSGEGLPSRSSTLAGGAMPAQLTTTRRGPDAAAVCTAAATCSGLGHIGRGEGAAELRGDIGPCRGGQVDDRDRGTRGGEAAGRREAEPARAAGHEGGGARDVHVLSFERPTASRGAALRSTIRGTRVSPSAAVGSVRRPSRPAASRRTQATRRSAKRGGVDRRPALRLRRFP